MSTDLLLERLQTTHLIHPVGELEPTFHFNHVLMQETAYQSMLVRERRDLHKRVAAAFEDVYADRLETYIPTLAYHYWRGEEWGNAAKYARRAGELAMRVYALREAIGYFAQALQALERQPAPALEESFDALLGWAQAAFGFEPFPKILEQLERAEQIARTMDDKRRLAMALLMLGRVHLASGHGSQAYPFLQECFTLANELGDDRLAATPTVAMGMVALDEDPQRALELFNRAAELARRYGDVDTEANALSMGAVMQAWLGREEACRQNLEQALQMVDRCTSPMSAADVYLGAAWALLDLGENPRAVELARVSVDKALAADGMECACFGFAILGMSHLRMEQLDEAVRAFEEAVRRSKISGAEEAEILGESGLGMVRFVEGHPGAIQALEDAYARAQKIGKEYTAALIAQTLGNIYSQNGQPQRSLAYFNKAIEYYRGHDMRLHWSRTLELFAKFAEAQGDAEHARQLRAERAQLVQKGS